MKAVNWLKSHRKLVIVAALVVILIAIVIVFFGDDKKSEKSDTEVRLMNILERIDGIGQTDVMITEGDGMITGVVVVCDGADSILVRNNVLNAVSTALDIDRSIIAIYSM